MCDSMKASRVCWFLRLSVVLWCLLLYGHCRSWDSCLVPGPVIVTLPIGLSYVLFSRLSVVLWCLLLYGLCRPWDSCLVPGPVIVTIGFSCVLFLRLSVVLWSLLLYSLYLSAVRLFVPCIVVADPIGCLSYSHLVRLSVEFRHSLSIVCSPWATTPHPTGRGRVSGERRWLSPRGLIPGH